MALNPPLTSVGGLPVAVPGEIFLLRRDGISFKVTFEEPGMKPVEATGSIHVTSFRIVFVTKSPSKGFYSFDIPINNISGEKFNQPIFGANYLSGNVSPIPSLGLSAPVSFKMYFKEGGCGTFIRVFFMLMEQAIKHRAVDEMFPEGSAFNSHLASGDFLLPAYMDPSDPSVVYVSQPAWPAPSAVPVKSDDSSAAIPVGVPVAYPVPAYAPPASVRSDGYSTLL